MSQTLLSPAAAGHAVHLPHARADDLVREFLAGRKATMLRAYQAALVGLARFAPTAPGAWSMS